MIRLRLSTQEAHYGGGLVDGAYTLKLFGDVATELLIRHDGDEGLFRAYENINFYAPVHAGDYLEVSGEIIDVGNTSRKIKFKAHKVITSKPEIRASAAEVLNEKILVADAIGTCIVLKECQRYHE